MKPKRDNEVTTKNKAGKPAAKSGNSTGNPPATGRPYKQLDAELFERLCFSLCTYSEIEAMMKADMATLQEWCKRTWGKSFSEKYKEFSEGGKASLRRTQLRLAQKNAAMAIWCGKQYLGQTDHDKGQGEAISQAALAIIGAVDVLSKGAPIDKSTQPEAD